MALADLSGTSTSLKSALTLPKLKEDGSNWVLFSRRLVTTINGIPGYRRHLSGSVKPPKALTDAEKADPDNLEAYEAELDEYESKQSGITALILASIPERFQIRVMNCGTAHAMWEKLRSYFEDQSILILSDLLGQLHAIRHLEGTDPLKTIDELLKRGNEYAAAGGELKDHEAAAILIRAMPKEQHPVIKSLITTAREQGKPFSLDSLIAHLTESIKLDQRQEKEEKDISAAMAARYKDFRAKQGNQNSSRSHDKASSDTKCYNCGGTGHFSRQCPSPKDNSKNQSQNQSNNESADSNSGGSSKRAKRRGRAKQANEKSGEGNSGSGGSKPGGDGNESFAFNAQAIGVARKAAGANGRVVRLLDTGASQHYDPDIKNFVDLRACEPYPIETATGQIVTATQMGTVKFVCEQDGVSKIFALSNVYYTPQLPCPLISLGRLRASGVVFSNSTDGFAELREKKTGRLVLKVPVKDNVYPIATWRPSLAKSATAPKRLTLMEAHFVLGHISPEAIKRLVREDMVSGIEIDIDTPVEECQKCIEAKMKRTNIAKSHPDPRSSKAGEYIHSDIWGPAQTTAKGGFKYYIQFKDDFTRFNQLYLMKNKNDAFSCYKPFAAWMKTQHGLDIKTFHSDAGGEFRSGEFDTYLRNMGTEPSYTAHDTPEKNGVAERTNYTLLDYTRAMLVDSGLPKSLWGHAIQYAVWLSNRMPTKALAKHSKTPYEMLYGQKPDLSKAHRWGCEIFVKKLSGKLEPRAQRARWVGPSTEVDDGHKVYWPCSGRITIERDVHFIEESAIEGENGAQSIAVLIQVENQQKNATETIKSSPSNVSIQPSGHPAPEINQNLPESDLNAQKRSLSFSSDDIDPLEALETGGDDPETKETIRKSTRIRKPSAYVRKVEALADPSHKYPKGFQLHPKPSSGADAILGHAKAAVSIPANLKDAKASEHWQDWKAGMDKEYTKLTEMQTFLLVPRSEASDVIPLQWVYDTKYDDNGNIVFKARVVARGDRQKKYINYTNTWSPVMRPASRNILLALAARNSWHVCQGDFTNAYLNGTLWPQDPEEQVANPVDDDETLDQPIYVEQVPGYEVKGPNGEEMVCLLLKALYGLKQAGRIWYFTLREFLESLGFSVTLSDPAVFCRHSKGSYYFIGLHVDDPMQVLSNLLECKEVEKAISTRFRYKSQGELHRFLGCIYERNWEAGTISAHQLEYIDAAIEQSNLCDARPVSTPLEPGHKYGNYLCPTDPSEIAAMKRVPYREVLGLLMYIANGTRPDIAFAVNLLAQAAKNPGHVHWEALKHVVRYLKGTRDYRLTWGTSKTGLVAYSDASHASEDIRYKSMNGYVFLIDGGAISWSAKKQELTALSTAESEYIAMVHAVKELVWIRSFISEILGPLSKPIILHVDNQAAIAMAKNSSFHSRTKHIALRYHFIREQVALKSVFISWIDTHHNCADLFTKALDSTKTKFFSSHLGLFCA
jgi:hypothetical protein